MQNEDRSVPVYCVPLNQPCFLNNVGNPLHRKSMKNHLDLNQIEYRKVLCNAQFQHPLQSRKVV